jgi:outer membrane assembly lipoprotein YfiO
MSKTRGTAMKNRIVVLSAVLSIVASGAMIAAQTRPTTQSDVSSSSDNNQNSNPKAADAGMRIISLNMKMMRMPDLNQGYTYKAHEAIRHFLEQFPESEHASIARQHLKEIEEILAGYDFEMANSYASKDDYAAAISRLKTIIDNYPDYSHFDEAKRLYESLRQSQPVPPK